MREHKELQSQRKSIHLLVIGAVLMAIATLETNAFGTAEKHYTQHAITTRDGINLNVQEWGNSEGPAILFIHGYSQTHMIWEKQVKDPELAKKFRMITFDLRGHGMSDKPGNADYYREGERWADDVATIIDSLDVDNTVLVASSMGGRIAGDYVAHHGEEKISGFIFVGALLLDEPTQWFGPATKYFEPMTSADMGTAIDGTKHFVESFFVNPPAEDEIRTMIAYTMMTPRHVRMALLGRSADYERHWQELNAPVLLCHGLEDQIIDPGMSKNTAELIGHAQTLYMDDIGHVPFLEVPERFNNELAEFVWKSWEE